MSAKEWNCFSWTKGVSKCLVVLNRPLNRSQICFMEREWSNSVLKVAVDGGINTLHAALPQLVPDFIVGDLDSADPQLLQEYTHRGSTVVATPDQDQTDFTKCLRYIARHVASNKIKVDFIFVCCTPDGRLDQVMANINTLFLTLQDKPGYDVILHSGDEVTWVLSRGKHVIRSQAAQRGKYCGLLPIGSSVKAITKGLKWNLNGEELEFGALVSSSNQIDEDEVFIEVDKPIVWCMTLKQV